MPATDMILPGKSLADLRLQIGEPVRVEIKAPRGRYTAKLLGYAPNGGIIISSPGLNNSSVSSLVNEGNLASLRLMAGNRICSFTSKILKISEQPFGYWILEQPAQTETRLIRKHTRVPVRMMASIDDYDEMGERADLPVTALCIDISRGGACLQLPRALGEVGDKFYLTTRMQIDEIDQVLLAPIRLRNLHTSGAEVNHGVEFIELDEDSRLIVTAFVYQQFLIETGNLDQMGQEM